MIITHNYQLLATISNGNCNHWRKEVKFEKALKLDVVQYSDESLNREAEWKFKANKKCIQQWKLQKWNWLLCAKQQKKKKIKEEIA